VREDLLDHRLLQDRRNDLELAAAVRTVLQVDLESEAGHWLVQSCILLFFGYASGYLSLYPQEVLIAWFVATPIALSLTHLLLRHYIPLVMPSQGNQRTAVIAGMNPTGLSLASQIRGDPFLGVRLVGFFDDRSRQRLDTDGMNQALLGKIDSLAAFIKENRIDLIYISLPMASQPRIHNLLDDLRDTTASIYFVPDIFVTDLIQGAWTRFPACPSWRSASRPSSV
jgi:putative colanic acid biosynthesis UDP-glucose lipid carrier transferase